jgi:outer membrane protein
MKHLKTILLAVVLTFAVTGFTNAQSKVAHINTQELVASMPAMKTAQAELQKLAKTYETAIQDQAKEFEAKRKQYAGEAETKTEEENTKRVQEIQAMQQNIQQYQGQAQQDLQKKEFDLYKPITEKARVAIQKVARAQGFQYVLDSSQGAGVILADGKDLSADVKKELGF